MVGIDLRGRGRGGILMGAILVLVGIAFLLDHMGYVSVYSLWSRFWPLLVVLAGVVNFASRNRPWGLFLMAAGVLLQLNQLGITHFGWRDFWPMLLIAIGILVLWGSFGWSKKPAVSSPTVGDPRTTLNEAVVFGGLERRMTSQDFQGGDITAIFGGVELDLTESHIQGNEATLAITAVARERDRSQEDPGRSWHESREFALQHGRAAERPGEEHRLGERSRYHADGNRNPG